MSEYRPLILAEEANPEWTSVPLVGWSHAQAIARALPGAHLVTQVRNAPALTRAGLVEGLHFTAINSESVAAGVYRAASALRGGAGKGWTTLMALSAISYAYFESLVWRTFRDRLIRGEFNVVHRITPVSPTISSRMAGWCRRIGVPFVLGPINGGLPWPRGFDHARRREREWLSYLRAAHRLVPGYHATRRHAAAILVGSRHTWAQMPHRYRHKCLYLPENAVDPQRFGVAPQSERRGPIHAVFVGRLVPYKGAEMLIEAAAPLARDGRLTVELIGDGPQRNELERMVDHLGLHGRVQLIGALPHAQVQHRLARADVLAFPSIREFGGGVVLEAMAMGVVPIVVDYGGPAELVTRQTGITVPLGSRRDIVAGFTAVLSRVADRPQLLEPLSRAAVQRVRERFTWDAKARRVLDVYRWVLGDAGKPALSPADTEDRLPQIDADALAVA